MQTVDIPSFEYTSKNDGPRLLITGGVHGNEHGCVHAVEKLKTYLDDGTIALKQGTLSVIPLINKRAYEEKQRFIDRDLNRNMHYYDDIKHHEDPISNTICPHLEKADILLDLHAYEGGDIPFVSLGPDKVEEKEFGTMVGPTEICWGFQQSFADQANASHGIGMTEYARQFDAIAITVECGYKFDDIATRDVGFDVILNTLQYFGYADTLDIERTKYPYNDNPPTPKWIKYNRAYLKQKDGTPVRVLKHLDKITEGEELYKYDDGEIITAPYDGFAVMPRKEPKVGETILYAGLVDEPLKDAN